MKNTATTIKSHSHKIILLVILFLTSPFMLNAQCAMCRAALETSGQTKTAEGINHGIAYLMVFPYLIVGVLGFVVYRIIKKEKLTN